MIGARNSRRRHPQTQPAPEPAAPPLAHARRGLTSRARTTLARRGVLRALASPAVAPLVAVAVVAVFAAIAVGVVLGLALAAANRGGGDWT